MPTPIISLTISASAPNISRAAFGRPGILSANATFPARTALYSSLDAMVTAGFATTSPEYIYAKALTEQARRVTDWKLLRLANKPTQRWNVGVAQVLNSTAYKLEVDGVVKSITSGGSATNDAIIAALVTEVDAVAGLTATAIGSAGSQTMRVVADTAGAWHYLRVLDTLGAESPDYLSLEQDHADPGVEADLTAIANEDNDWYGVLNPYASKAMNAAIATWVESHEKLGGLDTVDTASETTVLSGATDLGATLKGLLRQNCYVARHPNGSLAGAARWMGYNFPNLPGSDNWMFAQCAGLTAHSLTDTQKDNLTNKRVNYFSTDRGANFWRDGITPSGKYIDYVRGLHAFMAGIREDQLLLFLEAAARGSKVPYSDIGFAQIEGRLRQTIKRFVGYGFFQNVAPVISVPLASSATPEQIAARTVPNMPFSVVLAGAANGVTLTATLTDTVLQ